jgi:glycyl-tRNA synthetase
MAQWYCVRLQSEFSRVRFPVPAYKTRIYINQNSKNCMYIVKQKISGKDYYYIRKSKREGKKIKSTLVAYGGKTLDEAKEKIGALKEVERIKKEKKDNKNMEKKQISIEELANFCSAKGFVFRSSDIYGGLAGFWDFGPLGIEMFNNLKQDWWKFFVRQKDNIIGIEASIISHPRTWKASGHLENFNDISVVCKQCMKADKIDKSEVGKVKCVCGGEYDIKGEFSLMFKTSIGSLNPTEAYLRGETAQGMFLNFKLVNQTSRMTLPFGIAQIGRCFRNEIAPRDFLFRSREFHIGEFEFFVNPEEKKCELLSQKDLKTEFDFLDEETQLEKKDSLKRTKIKILLENNKLEEWHAYWLSQQINWFLELGLKNFKIREHTKQELSHYSSATFDIDYEYPFGSREVAGNANRGQYDLTQHQNESKEKMEIFDEKYKKSVIPKVIEPTFGMERVFLALISDSMYYDKERDNIVLKLPPKIAPIKAAVFPIIKKPEYEEISKKITDDLKKYFNVSYDKSGSIGRRYARNDEIGTPMCITIDEETQKNNSVTIRDRDTTMQIRVKISELKSIIEKVINGKDLLSLGKIIKK